MDEYIKREDALDAVLFALVGTGYQSRALDAVRYVPTADVSPRAEVERLERILNSYALQYGTVVDKQKVIDEAIKEFAENFESEITCIPQHHFTMAEVLFVLNKLVKERIGGR